ncbi:zincin-like metallopeptidase domain-containing protein [Thalassococcus profundi]|uniref:zincin-like metallopeptidase domain-containing protein n=1 Tax=Thalassococcus profundi TaxID=2282382 RepID=UPI001EE9DB63|nr:zincin-like metallopeptidase domain-containing protein [Thalassococcus profundi]
MQMPIFESFRSPEAYYATLAHELTHWLSWFRHRSGSTPHGNAAGLLFHERRRRAVARLVDRQLQAVPSYGSLFHDPLAR